MRIIDATNDFLELTIEIVLKSANRFCDKKHLNTSVGLN